LLVLPHLPRCRTLLQSSVPSKKKKLSSGFAISEKIKRIEEKCRQRSLSAAAISPDLQQRQCRQVLPRNLTLLPSRMPSQRNLTMHLQYLLKCIFDF